MIKKSQGLFLPGKTHGPVCALSPVVSSYQVLSLSRPLKCELGVYISIAKPPTQPVPLH